MRPSAIDRSSAAVSAVAPLPTRSGVSGTAPRTRLRSAMGVGSPVADPDTTSASARPRETASRASCSMGRGREGYAVLGLYVGEDLDVQVEESPVAQGLVGARLQQTLVGDDRTDVDVDADEARAGGRRDREGGERIGLEHVDADGQRDGAADLADGDGHGGDGGGVHPSGSERHVPVVLDQERVDVALGEGAGIVEGRLDHRGHAPGPARTPRERAQVHHADHRLGPPGDGGEAHGRRAGASDAARRAGIARNRDKRMAEEYHAAYHHSVMSTLLRT